MPSSVDNTSTEFTFSISIAPRPSYVSNERFPLALCQRDHNWQLHQRNIAFAALRPVYPGGSNVFTQAGLHVLPLAQGQRRAQHEGHFKVAVNSGKPDGRHFERDFRSAQLVWSAAERCWRSKSSGQVAFPVAARYFRITHSVLSVMHSCSDSEESDSLCFPNL